MIDFLGSWKENNKYFEMLSLMGQLSKLFSSSDIPFIHYRITENLFCKYFDANNLSRTDTAYDAKYHDIGIGIKTFTLNSDSSIEKIAEFNTLSSELKLYSGKDLACKLAQFRNERMRLANDLYGINKPIYHIIGRVKGGMKIFNTPYDFVSIDKISVISDNVATLKFTDGIHEYNYNRSKSVLMKRFILPANDVVNIPVQIIDDPYSLLEKLLQDNIGIQIKKQQMDYVILPLYSRASKNSPKEVPTKSGLNQWNAKGRPRDVNEVYISIPSLIHKLKPTFFPNRDQVFNLHLPDGTLLQAKVCQEGNKALMSNPNKDLGKWILRKVLKLPEGELLTMEKLNIAGFDSMIVYKKDDSNYMIDVCYNDSFDNYL